MHSIKKQVIWVFIFFLFVFKFPGYSQFWKTYPYTPPGSLISFPSDEGAHIKEPIEWWYTVGHLVGQKTGTRYSYMVTYYNYPSSGFEGFRIFNISNDDKGKFFSEMLPLNFNVLSENSLEINAQVFSKGTEVWSNQRDDLGQMIPFKYQLSSASQAGKIDLYYNALKPPLILCDSGFFYQGTSSYTYYYSQTGVDITGTITLEGLTEEVIGTAWIDRQYGTFNPLKNENYEWFNVQLSNGMDLNVYSLFKNDNTLPDSLAYKTLAVYVDSLTQYTTSDFNIERLKFRFNADSSRCYSQKWHLTSKRNNLDLIIETYHSHYEVTLPFKFYEGPTAISGTVNGKKVSGSGFAELLHSYKEPVLAFKSFSSNLISWELENPDNGRPLKYDLEYSVDEKVSFRPLVSGTENLYYEGDNLPEKNYWLKLKAYSIDSTLLSVTLKYVNSTLYSTSKDADASSDLPDHVIKDDFLIFEKIFPGQVKEIRITDLCGATHYLDSKDLENQLVISLKGLHSGLYFCQIVKEQKLQIIKFIVK